MSFRTVDDLIKVAGNIVNGGFDIRAVYQWREQAIEFLNDHLGPDHYYTQSFDRHVKQVVEKDVLAAKGILIAAKEVISQDDTKM